jgi:hypothetical protein
MGLEVGTTWYERGYAEGVARGPRKLIRIQLDTLYGPLSRRVEEKLAAWPADKLTDLGLALLTAKSLHELGLEE